MNRRHNRSGHQYRVRVRHTSIQKEFAESTGPIFFATGATRSGQKLRLILNFVQKRDCEALKQSNGQYWYKIRHCLHVQDDSLLIDERSVLPTQTRQTVLESMHLTHPRSAAMFELCQHIWFLPFSNLLFKATIGTKLSTMFVTK